LLTGKDQAFFELYEALKRAIPDYLQSIELEDVSNDSAQNEISDSAEENNRGILDQITFDNYSYYLGFDSL
jgi:hypothetical protein